MKQTILSIFFAIISMVAKAQPCINSKANAANVGDCYTVSQIAYRTGNCYKVNVHFVVDGKSYQEKILLR